MITCNDCGTDIQTNKKKPVVPLCHKCKQTRQKTQIEKQKQKQQLNQQRKRTRP